MVVRVTGQATKANPRNSSWLSLIGSCALLLVIVAAVAVAAGAAMERSFSVQAMQNAAIAGSVCYLAAALSLVATFLGNRWGFPLQGVLAGMGFRMGLPLLVLIGFGAKGTLGATIVVVYLLALIVDTILTLRMSQAGGRRDGGLDLTDTKPRPSVAS